MFIPDHSLVTRADVCQLLVFFCSNISLLILWPTFSPRILDISLGIRCPPSMSFKFCVFLSIVCVTFQKIVLSLSMVVLWYFDILFDLHLRLYTQVTIRFQWVSSHNDVVLSQLILTNHRLAKLPMVLRASQCFSRLAPRGQIRNHHPGIHIEACPPM